MNSALRATRLETGRSRLARAESVLGQVHARWPRSRPGSAAPRPRFGGRRFGAGEADARSHPGHEPKSG